MASCPGVSSLPYRFWPCLLPTIHVNLLFKINLSERIREREEKKSGEKRSSEGKKGEEREGEQRRRKEREDFNEKRIILWVCYICYMMQTKMFMLISIKHRGTWHSKVITGFNSQNIAPFSKSVLAQKMTVLRWGPILLTSILMLFYMFFILSFDFLAPSTELCSIFALDKEYLPKVMGIVRRAFEINICPKHIS